MTDKTKSSVKDDANNDAPKAKKTAAAEEVKPETATSAPEKVADSTKGAESPIEAGKDTVNAGAGDETLPEEEGDVPAPTLDTVKIKELINQIDNAGGQSPLDLVHRLIQEEGFKPVDGEDGREMVAMAGVSCRAQKSPGVTLQNWCNAARRALLKAA
ncbi:MAG TPA: hypothetical protein DF966_09710 [Sulfitobacter sp.]|nr:hypothetical protein [Sulfitobacter sp.]